MVSFRVMRKIRPEGFDCHHLIPAEIFEMRSLAVIVGKARSVGFDPDNFLTNGMLLPNDERNAACFKLPLHRAPYPRYNALVVERISSFDQATSMALRVQMEQLQKDWKRGPRKCSIDSIFEFRDPLRPRGDFRKIDGKIALLWAVTDPLAAVA